MFMCNTPDKESQMSASRGYRTFTFTGWRFLAPTSDRAKFEHDDVWGAIG